MPKACTTTGRSRTPTKVSSTATLTTSYLSAGEVMEEFVGFTITGVVTASIYALVACGLTLTYSTTGIFNWALGAFAAVGAFAYWQLTVGWGWPVPIAFALCLLLLGPALGAAVERGIMRRLEGTSTTTTTGVTLALLVGLVAAVSWIWDPSEVRVLRPLFPANSVSLVGQRIPVYDLLVVAVGIAVALSLRWLLYGTRRGVEIRGGGDRPPPP